ncbi:MAG TPA: M23 family metallopeptidase [Acidimicrobiales bacterium]
MIRSFFRIAAPAAVVVALTVLAAVLSAASRAPSASASAAWFGRSVVAAPSDDRRDRVTYRPPVDAPVADGFRPPATRYGAGNRGVDYDTATGDVVRAAADGRVVFAGRVGLGLHVVVLHADGIRTSYSFLDAVGVARGDRVHAGKVVGTAGESLHVGARAGDAYLDPLVLFGQRAGRVHLVDDDDGDAAGRRAAPVDERRGLVDGLAGATGAGP